MVSRTLLISVALAQFVTSSLAMCGVNVMNVAKGNVVVGSGCVIEGGEATIRYKDSFKDVSIPVTCSNSCGCSVSAGRVLPPDFSLQKTSPVC